MYQQVKKVHSAVLLGIEAHKVVVEVSIGPGLPGISIVGMPDTAVQEARMRVRSAIRASGFIVPRKAIMINLAPASLKKSGTGLDFAIAAGILAATDQIPQSSVRQMLLVGELSLSGEIRPVDGLVAYFKLAKKENLKLLVSEESLVPSEFKDVFYASKLIDLKNPSNKTEAKNRPDLTKLRRNKLDYTQVHGQELAKRALVIAAAGKHSVLMIGPPGCGKTMLAQRFPTILNPLTRRQIIEVMLVYSVLGVNFENVIDGQPPFRAPHHSSSLAGLIGGGRPVKPGEISLAHNGILFLDELSEFQKNVLQALRQIIEEKEIRLVRSEGTFKFPANFQLLCATNPCACGYYGDEKRRCICSETSIQNYQTKLGGPLLDRIDMHVRVDRPASSILFIEPPSKSSNTMSKEVERAINFRLERLTQMKRKRVTCSSLLDMCHMNQLSQNSMFMLKNFTDTGQISLRSVAKSISLARTVADVENSEKVLEEHVAEALSYRDLSE